MEDLTIPEDELIRLIPSMPQAVSYFFDEIIVTQSQTGERQRRVVVSFASPSGVYKIWFDGEALARFATEALEKGLDAQTSVLQVATNVGDELLVAKEILGG